MATNEKVSKVRVIASGVIPFVFVILMMVYIFGPGADLLDFGVSLPEITLEKINFEKSEIHVTVRNTGPIPVVVAMADVNDRIQPATIE
ncbi:MAG: divalent cation transporter, partial [Nitrosarchaeum sp.]